MPDTVVTTLQVVPYDQSSTQLAVAAPQQATQQRSHFDKRTDAAVWAEKTSKGKDEDGEEEMSWSIWLQGIGLIGMSGIDNALSYLTFLTVRAFHGRLYNIVDLHMTLLPGIDMVLLSFAVLGTLIFVSMIVLVECLKQPFFHELMNARLFFSAMPCGIVSAILLYHSEQTQWAPFATVVAVLSTIFFWCLHMRVQYRASLNVLSKISLDISWLLALVCVLIISILFGLDLLKVMTGSEDLGCPYAPNNRMPVKILPLERWYCAPWDEDEPMLVAREPVNEVPVQLTCTDSFIAAFASNGSGPRVRSL